MPPFRRTAYLLAASAVAAAVVTLVWKPAPPASFVGIKTGEVPVRLGDFQSLGDYTVPPDVLAALSSADIVARTYTGGGGNDPIDFILIGGTDRSALHDPRSCLVGGGWTLEDDRSESLPGTSIQARSCHAVGGPGTSSFDIVYLYIVDGQIRNQVTQIRAEMLVSALLGRKNRPVYFLRFMVPLSTDTRTVTAGHERLLSFAADTWKTLAPRLGVPGA